MESMAERWTDDRMDDLKGQVEKLERRVDSGFRELRSEMSELRREMGALRTDMDERFERLDARIDAMLYALIGFGGAMFAAMATLVVAVLLS